MKKIILKGRFIYLSVLFVISSLLISCDFNEYLDKSPNSGLGTEEVFSNYDNFMSYFNTVYEGADNGVIWGIRSTYDYQYLRNGTKLSILYWTDASDMPRSISGVKRGICLSNFSKVPFFESNYKVIRVCNQALANIDKLKGVNQIIKDDIVAQAYFVRAYAHFESFRFYGAIPYIKSIITGEDEWDLKRPEVHDMLALCAEDCDSAVVYFKKANAMRRDNPAPGQGDNLNNINQGLPTGIAALALKSRVLLYNASPLYNVEGNVEFWKQATLASWEAIKVAKDYGYELQKYSANPEFEKDEYKMNYTGTKYSNEHLWAWNTGTRDFKSTELTAMLPAQFQGQKNYFQIDCPTQNFVDRFETKWGESLRTEEDRQKAIALGHYSDQNPYKDRDPRLSLSIIYNQAPLPGTWQNGKAQIWHQGTSTYGELSDPTFPSTYTGYYLRKSWGGQSIKNKVNVIYTDPLFRLAEQYLNFAEAANEAYGSTTIVPGTTLSAIDAIQEIRGRFNLPIASIPTDQTLFRDKIQNERTVELCFEGRHYYYDIRRWKTAPLVMSTPLIAMDVEKVDVSAEYPTGFKYARIPMIATRQVAWFDYMYYFPVDIKLSYKMKNFEFYKFW